MELATHKKTAFPLRFMLSVFLLVLADLLVVRDFTWLRENLNGTRFLINYPIALIGLASLLYVVNVLMRTHRVLKIIATCLIGIPFLLQLFYFSVYRKFIPPFGFSMVTEDFMLVLRLGSENIPILRSLILLIILAATLRLLPKLPKPFTWRFPVNLFLFLASTAYGVFAWYSVNDFENSTSAFYNALTDNALRSSKAFRVQRPTVPTKIDTATGTQAVILIIGESTCLTHMSLYGYPRKTTPFLDSLQKTGRLIAFTNAVSVGNKTNLSVPYLLTGLEGPDPTGRFYNTPTLFAYAKASGRTTAFLTAQDFKWGHMDKILIDRNVDLFLDGSTQSANVDVLDGIDDMQLLNMIIHPFLDTVRAPFLLVLQMNGSHYPYAKHCPQEFKVFLPETSENSVEAYDNTILYTDLFLSRFYSLVKKRFPDSWIFFSPDHGQNLGTAGGKYNDSFLNDVIHNPLLIFPPDHNTSIPMANLNAPVSQADIVPTILKLLDTKPIRPIDGLCLLDTLPKNRLRVCSEYMPTFHNNPSAVVFLPDFQCYKIDFTKQNALLPDGKNTIPYVQLPDQIRRFLAPRMAGRPNG